MQSSSWPQWASLSPKYRGLLCAASSQQHVLCTNTASLAAYCHPPENWSLGMAMGLQPAQQQHPLLASVSANTRWLCTPSLHRHLSPATQARLGYRCCQLGHGHPECCPPRFLLPETAQQTWGSSNNNLNASVKYLEMGDGQPEAFRAYSVILAGLGGFLPLLFTPMTDSVLGLVVPGLNHSPEAACGSAGGQWCGSPCLLLCALPHHTSAPCGCQDVLVGSLPQFLQ